MQRSSQRDSDELILQPAAIPLGAVGLDLRAPTNPGALTKLINARYRDEKTLDRRSGYRGVRLQDGSEFNSTSNAPTGWAYGIGQVAGGVHHPKPLQTRGGFTLGNTDVAWTGDRLLIVREGETCIGQHEFWSRGDGEVLDHGIPAYLPVQTDSTPPDVISGDYVETALTNDLRGIIASTAAEEVVAWIVHRETGAVLDRTVLDYGTAIRETPLQ